MIARILNGAMALLFLFAASLQFNDPDAPRWVAIYAAAALVSGLAAFRPLLLPWYAPAVVAAVALAWAGTIAPRALGRIPLSEMFRSWEMKNELVEENREFFGLLIVAAWMVVAAVLRLRSR